MNLQAFREKADHPHPPGDSSDMRGSGGRWLHGGLQEEGQRRRSQPHRRTTTLQVQIARFQ